MNVIEIKLVDIEVGNRLREIDQDYVGLLAASMEESGQRTPIEVRPLKAKGKRPYELIAGGHRWAALEAAGIETAYAIVLTVSDLEAKMLEIDENLIRRELSALDRATFLAERKRVYERLHPETTRGGDRRSDQTDNLVRLIGSFSAATADRLGLDERTIRRSVSRFQRLLPDVRAAIHATWIADSGSQLDALAKLTPEQQRAVADWIGSGNGSLRTVADILRVIEKRPAPEAATAYEKFLRLWRTADSQTRAQIRAFLATEGTGAQRSAA